MILDYNSKNNKFRETNFLKDNKNISTKNINLFNQSARSKILFSNIIIKEDINNGINNDMNNNTNIDKKHYDFSGVFNNNNLEKTIKDYNLENEDFIKSTKIKNFRTISSNKQDISRNIKTSNFDYFVSENDNLILPMKNISKKKLKNNDDSKSYSELVINKSDSENKYSNQTNNINIINNIDINSNTIEDIDLKKIKSYKINSNKKFSDSNSKSKKKIYSNSTKKDFKIKKNLKVEFLTLNTENQIFKLEKVIKDNSPNKFNDNISKKFKIGEDIKKNIDFQNFIEDIKKENEKKVEKIYNNLKLKDLNSNKTILFNESQITQNINFANNKNPNTISKNFNGVYRSIINNNISDSIKSKKEKKIDSDTIFPSIQSYFNFNYVENKKIQKNNEEGNENIYNFYSIGVEKNINIGRKNLEMKILQYSKNNLTNTKSFFKSPQNTKIKIINNQNVNNLYNTIDGSKKENNENRNFSNENNLIIKKNKILENYFSNMN